MELDARGTATTGDLATQLPRLLTEARVATVQLDVLTRPESFRGGSVSAEAQAITGAAREEHRARHFGFWEFVLAQTPQADRDTRLGLLSGAVRHHSAETISLQLDLPQLTDALQSGSFDGLPARTIVSLTSNVVLEHSTDEWHLPMLDMGLPIGPDNQATCTDALENLGVTGLLLESGQSYHFIGNQAFSARDLTRLLAQAQLLSPIVDARWVSHQLIDDYCALRISTEDTNIPAHRVVARIKRR